MKKKGGGLLRRSFLAATSSALVVPAAGQQRSDPSLAVKAAAQWEAAKYTIEHPTVEGVRKLLAFNDLDQAIWRDELESFVPSRLCDMHSHMTRYEFDLSPDKANEFHWTLPSAPFRRASSVELIDACEAVFYPGRTVDRMVTPSPNPKVDFAASNEFIVREAAKKPAGVFPLMLVHPGMPVKHVESLIGRHRYFGFKPYRYFSITGDIDNCRITDFMPENQIEVADHYHLIILLHISRKGAIADPANVNDIERLAKRYPNVRFQMAHCARSYSNWALDAVAPRLRALPNLWYDTSSVSDSDAFYALFTGVPLDRICYGSDDFAVGVSRGKYVTYGRSWAQMDELNQTLNRAHCDGRFTFVRYEMLRGMKRAAIYANLTKAQIDAIFYDNGRKLIEDTRRNLNRILGAPKPAV
jgi:predicted TIM-barrel fold metal-dependent hydrolase